MMNEEIAVVAHYDCAKCGTKVECTDLRKVGQYRIGTKMFCKGCYEKEVS